MTFVNHAKEQMFCFACLFGTRDTQCSLADNLFADTRKRSTSQPSAITAGPAGAAAELRLPSGGREDEHTGQ